VLISTLKEAKRNVFKADIVLSSSHCSAIVFLANSTLCR
jgi:hypothetical protein